MFTSDNFYRPVMREEKTPDFELNENSSCHHLPKPKEGNRQTYQNIIHVVVCTKNRLILIFMSVITKINKLILLHANLFSVLRKR